MLFVKMPTRECRTDGRGEHEQDVCEVSEETRANRFSEALGSEDVREQGNQRQLKDVHSVTVFT